MITTQDINHGITLDDLYWFREGTHFRLYRKLGAQLDSEAGIAGVRFTVWAPNAEHVSVIGDFNAWNASEHPLRQASEQGVWSVFIPQLREGSRYKFHLVPRSGAAPIDKADPFAFNGENPPGTASVIWDLSYDWNDAAWMLSRAERHQADRPISIYEVHLASWMRVPEEGNRPLTYLELAPRLAEYARGLNFTHVQLAPLMEHTLYESLGCQPTACFTPTCRHGSPQDFMRLVDYLHHQHLGVILDWGLACIPGDEPGLANFDGTHLFERDDLPAQHPPGGGRCLPFDSRRLEVRSFLLSNAFHWLDHYHIDGLNISGGFSEAIEPDIATKEFLRDLADSVAVHAPGVAIIAEHFAHEKPSGATAKTFSAPDRLQSEQSLRYFGLDYTERRQHHSLVSSIKPSRDAIVLSLAREEMEGRSLLASMWGDEWQKFANLRLLFAWLWAQPAKKRLFMGTEFAQWNSWNFHTSLDWHLVEREGFHRQFQQWVSDLNRLYCREPALHQTDANPDGFEWTEAHEDELSTAAWLRTSATTGETILAAFNFTLTPRHNHRLGVPGAGFWTEVLNGDAREYGGSGQGNLGGVEAAPFGWNHKSHSLVVTLPPLAGVFFKRATQPSP